MSCETPPRQLPYSVLHVGFAGFRARRLGGESNKSVLSPCMRKIQGGYNGNDKREPRGMREGRLSGTRRLMSGTGPRSGAEIRSFGLPARLTVASGVQLLEEWRMARGAHPRATSGGRMDAPARQSWLVNVVKAVESMRSSPLTVMHLAFAGTSQHKASCEIS